MTWQDDAGRDLVKSFGARMQMFVRGEGSYLWDADGKRYLDFLAGIAVDSLGHAHPVFVDAIATQAATLAHVSNYFATPPSTASRQARIFGIMPDSSDGRSAWSSGTSMTETSESRFGQSR